MPDNFQEVRRDIGGFFLALRHSIDRPYRPTISYGPEERESFTRSMLLVEEARIRFNSYVRFREEPTTEEWADIQALLIDFVGSFLDSPDIDRIVYDRPLRAISVNQKGSERSPFIEMVGSGKLNLIDAVISFREYIRSTTLGVSKQASLNFEDLKRVVPNQQIAPASFKVFNGRIVLSGKVPLKRDDDKENIESALDHLRQSGQHLIDSIEKSNCDKRLLDSVRELQSQILNDGNVIKIGLTNLACGVMCSEFEQELPNAINAMFNSYNSSVSMYIAQFPEWEQFTQRAASIEFGEDEVSEIDIAAGEVIEALESRPDLADPEVPKTIKFVREFMSRPGKSAKRAAFAMMRTIENLISSIVRHSLSTLNKTADKLSDNVSTAAARVIVGLLGVALIGATGIGAAAAQAGAPWVSQAAEVVKKEIEKLAAD